MQTADFDYELPEGAIAQEPLADRAAARLLVDRGPDEAPDHRHVADLPDLVGEGDVVVVNTTRVRRARLHLQKPTGGAVEVLLLHRRADGTWEALVRPSRRVAPGVLLHSREPVGASSKPDSETAHICVQVGDDLGGGRRLVSFPHLPDAVAEEAAIEAHGEVPLPPYIKASLADPGAYQTTFAVRTGSSAAPTAGLHLTPDVLDRIRARGAAVHEIDLEIGLDTFRPIDVDDVDDHPMHHEVYRVSEATFDACRGADRVIAVGTTVVRALESAAASGHLEGDTGLFIRRPYEFAMVDALLTNFHFPRSTLLLLVDACIGPRWRELYQQALDEGYRFLSFGDAMFTSTVQQESRP